MSEQGKQEWTSERVKQLRADLGLTLKEFGERCGVSLRTVQGWVTPENLPGHRRPRGTTIVVLDQLDKESKRTRGPVLAR